MVLISTLRQRCQPLNFSRLLKLNAQPSFILKRHGGHGNQLKIESSSFNFKKAKDLFHFYTCVAICIYSPIYLYFYVFHGKATLREIPEGYRPKSYEYYQHPITRFIQKYFREDHQELHEKFLHYLYEADEKHKLRLLDDQVDRIMKKRRDYEAHYYVPMKHMANVIRLDKEDSDGHKFDQTDSFTSSGFPIDLGEKDKDLGPEQFGIPAGVEE